MISATIFLIDLLLHSILLNYIASDVGCVPVYACRVKPVSQIPYQVPLIEDVLFSNVHLRDAAGIIDSNPQQATSLNAIQIF